MSVSHPRGHNRPPTPPPRGWGDVTQPLFQQNQETSEPSSPPARKNIATSMTSFINKFRPSKRPEKGSTARVTTDTTNQYWENHQAGEVRTASGSRPPPQRVNSVSRHSPDAIPSSLWRTPIPLPRRAHSTRERMDQGTTPTAAPRLIPRKQIPGPGRGENFGLRARNPNQTTRFQGTGEDDGDPLLPRHPSQAAAVSSRYTRDVFTVKQELRRQRRTLKESGDFLGVTGINPYTGQMDVITPTTSSEEASPPYSVPHMGTLAHTAMGAVGDHEDAQRREVWLKEHKEELNTILEQNDGNVKSKKKEAAWSSAASPKLSPIPQSQRSFSLHEMDSEGTVQQSPVNRSPNRSPFLGISAAAMKTGYHRPAIVRGDIPMPAIPAQQAGKSMPSSRKEDVEPTLEKSSSSKHRTIRFNLQPLMTRRSGHCLQEISKYLDDQLELHRPVAPSSKGHRYRHSLPDMKVLQRINSASVLQLNNLNPAGQWASGLMQDLGCSNASNQSNRDSGPSVRTALSTTGEEGMRDPFVYTPTTITTGSECSQKHPIPMDGGVETAEDYGDILLTPQFMSTPNTMFSPLKSSPSLPQTPNRIFSDPLASQIETRQNVWPSIESQAQKNKTAISTQEMALPRESKNPGPPSPKQKHDSVITSSVTNQEEKVTEIAKEQDTTESSLPASTESLPSPQPAQWSMRKTIRQKADDKEQGKEKNSGTGETAVHSSPASTSTSHSHPRREPHPLPPRSTPRKPSMDLDHAIARGAAREAFTHLVTATTTQESPIGQSSEVKPIKEPNGRRSIPRHHERRTVPAPVSDRESNREAGPEDRRGLAALVRMTLAGAQGDSRFGWNRKKAVLLLRTFLEMLCKWVRVVLVVVWILVSAYWDLVSPVFDGNSQLRKILTGEDNKHEATWEDWGICGMTLAFLFGVVVVGVWMIRGFVWVVWVVWKIVQGLWRILGV
ncbi:hypothetical protein QBC38DRAFT_456331 [Podospora fimiseda]|uniref:Uncharacterized protein n=1 Tax=Podospora fimiseda TaxID=252190 RepID=A0AAN7BN24_9PEZI|nr:hypothetical protein QBC38DRAFT_456331 [Podospora fimiseda]